MSMPTKGFLYKNGEQIGDFFYNIGWWMDEIRLYNDIKRVAEETGADMVRIYGSNIVVSEIPKLIEEENKRIEEHKEKMRKRAEERRASGDTGMKMPIVRSPMPAMIAEQIVGVQPMASEFSQMFKINTREHDENV